MTEYRCRHCGKPPSEQMKAEHPLCPWFASSIGPGGAWHHHYCSEACASHSDIYSRYAWTADKKSFEPLSETVARLSERVDCLQETISFLQDKLHTNRMR